MRLTLHHDAKGTKSFNTKEIENIFLIKLLRTMKKRVYGALILGSLLLTGGMVTSCSDYDDDINSLTQRVDAIEASVADLKSAIENGKTIKSVTSIENGFEIEFSDGQKYSIKNGENGTTGDTWTIGSDGYWYKNNNITEWKAVGTNGAAGENGQYYVPNTTTGCFDIYKDGEKVESTDISWKSGSMSAVFNGTQLTLSNVDLGNGETGDISFNVGVQLGSVAFIPEVVSNEVPYPTTTDEFLHLATYLDETKYDPTTRAFSPQAGFDKSNIIETAYRLNPSNANIQDAVLAFINRQVATRSAADKTSLLNCADYTWNDKEGTVSVKTTINASALSTDNKESDIAALQVWAGQNPVTSDYIYVESTPIDVQLADSMATLNAGSFKGFYPRTKSIAKGESSDFIQEFVKLTDATNFDFYYNGSIDLKKRAGLYSSDKDEFISDLGFTGMSYEFSLPEEYKAKDNQNTNQQWYVKMEDGVVSVNKDHLTESLIPAIGKTPVVRVDAFLTSNAGVKRLVASSYIKLNIVETIEEGEDQPDITGNIGNEMAFAYNNLTSATTKVGEMPWTEVNNVIYGKTNLTSKEFWKYYGGKDDVYQIQVTTTNKTGNTVTLINQQGNADELVSFNNSGIYFDIRLNNVESTETSNIKVSINNLVKTQNTYKDVNGKGAEYKVTITIPSDNIKARGNVVLTQTFYVKETCAVFNLNPLYKEGENTIVVKGQLNPSKKWEMSSVVSEHFEKQNGKDIFNYYATTAPNALTTNGLTFEWATGVTGVTPMGEQAQDFTVALDGAMTTAESIKNMTYQIELVNGEYCNYNYNIKFINPFVGVNGNSIKVYGNGVGENTADVATEVLVNDLEKDAIFHYVGTGLTLTSKATNTYHVDEPTVKYAFDETNADYQTIIKNMSAGSILNVDASTGKFTWKNEGARLTKDYTLHVIATITFADLSEVQCVIPVVLTAEK